ncbi:MAG TPA: hypothetical protein DCM38_05255 [Gammaproteobacteria bacterium]|nr:hypothetical protein [Gammaproteobacteria bacterium]
MTLSKLILALASILIMGISLAACTGPNSKPSGPALTHDYADCISVPGGEQEKTTTAAAIAQKAQRRKTSSSEEPEQDSAGCILVPDSK